MKNQPLRHKQHNLWRDLKALLGRTQERYLIIFLLLSVAAICVITPTDILWSVWYWFLAKINPLFSLLNKNIKIGIFSIPFNMEMLSFDVPYHGKIYHITPTAYLSHKEFIKNAGAIVPYLKTGAGIGFVLTLGVLYANLKWSAAQEKKLVARHFIRGARLETIDNIVNQIKEKNLVSDIIIDDMPIITAAETEHFLIHGSTGVGKTQLIAKFLAQLRKRGDKVFLYDPDGVYLSKFYREHQDKILNPLDSRCENWDLWREALGAADFENLARSLIPRSEELGSFWINAARTIFGSTAFTMQAAEDRSIKKLLKRLFTSELHDLHNYLSDTAAAKFSSDKIEEAAVSIRSVITTYLKPLRFLIGLEQTSKPKFSIRDWLGDSQDTSWVFLSSSAGQPSLSPLFSMWFSLATNALLNLPLDPGRKVWFVCDELPSLHKLSRLPVNIAAARKYGGRFILSMQSYPQLETVYGKTVAQEIFDLMNSAFFFRSPSPDVAALVSKALGHQEIVDNHRYRSHGADITRAGMVNQIVTPAEIMNLAVGQCYLRQAGVGLITLMELTLDERSHIAESFIPSNLKLDQEIEDLISSHDLNVRNFDGRPLTSVS